MNRNSLKEYARIPEHVSRSYIRAAHHLREEPLGKRKLSVAFVLVMVLVLAAITALATVLLRGKDFVEEVMRPKAEESASQSWNQEEVESILRIAEANGLELSETQQAQLLASGGYYKEELMRIFMKLDLGVYPSAWSIEDQAWYAQMLVDIGLNDTSFAALPEAGEATEAEMLAVVQSHIHETYDPQAPLDDEAIYRRHTTYQWTQTDDEGTLEKQWYVSYEPLDLEHAAYRLTLDTDARILTEQMEPGLASREEPPTPREVLSRYEQLYGTYFTWEMETWVAFRQMLLEAASAHGYGDNEQLQLLALSAFALPEAGMQAEDEAIDAAMAAVMAREGLRETELQREKAYGVYLLGEEAPVWKVTLPKTAEGNYLAEVHAGTGELRTLHFLPYGTSSVARHFMLESVYQAHAKEPQPQAGGLRFDNRAYEAVEPLKGGGFLLVGSSWVSTGKTQAWAARIDASGDTRWEALLEEGKSIKEAVALSDGTFLLAMEPSIGQTFSLAVVQLDAEGQVVSGPVALAEQGWAYKGKDCLLVSKHYEGTGTRPNTLLAVNAQGETQWERTYDELFGTGYHPFPAADGYLLAGGAQDAPYDQETLWGMMARLDDQGNLLWVRRMKEPRTGISSHLETGDGGMFGAGMYFDKFDEGVSAEHSLSDFVVRFDAAGQELWCRNYPELAPEVGFTFFHAMSAPEDGLLVLARSLEGNDWQFLHLDGDGNALGQWEAPFEIADFARESVFTAGGQGYLIYLSRPEYEGNMPGPMNTFVTPVELPEP